MKTISIIGAGHVGQTLGRLFLRSDFAIQDVYNRQIDRAKASCRFIGGGIPCSDFSALKTSDVYAVTVSDDALADVVGALAKTVHDFSGTTVFHCGGAISSDVLLPLKQRGAHIASVHPVKSFADSGLAADTFAGTYCGMEGGRAALEVLKDIFVKIGGIPFEIASDKKLLYHAAAVIACNYLTVLAEAAQNCFAACGGAPEEVLKILAPIMHGTVDNNVALGPAQALTGPIARGDAALVEQQYKALQESHPDIAEIYKVLGQHAVQLAKAKGVADESKLSQIANILH